MSVTETATDTNPAWTDELLHDPHAAADKRSRVQRMFAAIAGSYDLNNRLHSFGLDQRWRRETVRLARLVGGETVVDVACGTGDLSLAFARSRPTPARVLGIDFTYEMLPLAEQKARANALAADVRFVNGDAQALPLPDASCDVVSIAFGIRNVQEPARAIAEFRRVLRPGGRLLILEFSQPTNRLVRWGNDLYCARIMPHTATWISGDRSGAYKYLPMSVKTFIDRPQMMQLMRDAGFAQVEAHPMTLGVCVCYRGEA